VRFACDGGEFVLTVADDGVGLPPEANVNGQMVSPFSHGTGHGTRLLRARVAQLRGSFARSPGPGGTGTTAESRFRAEAPGMPGH
jgi:signal transduction histidine kinase